MKKFFKDEQEKNQCWESFFKLSNGRSLSAEEEKQAKKYEEFMEAREPMTTAERETALKATLKVLNGEAVTEREAKQMRRYEKCYV